MKRLMLLFAVTLSVMLYSCEEECDGKGTLKVENKSLNTLQKLMIDGVNYGTVDPGETKEVDLAPGYHNWQLVGLDGGGCNEATVIIMECETSSYSCSGK